MTRPTVLCVALLAFWIGRAHGQAKGPVWMFGLGEESCGVWTPFTNSDVHAWILGYWSGLNAASPSNSEVGRSTDGAGIIAQVRKDCDADETAMIGYVEGQVYLRLRSQGR